MSRTGCRTPRKMYEKRCEGCGTKYTAFRSTSRFHSNSCRAQHCRQVDEDRSAGIARSGGKCDKCGVQYERPYWRAMPSIGSGRWILCGVCFSAESRRKFWERVPVSERHHYVRNLRRSKSSIVKI